MKKIKIGLIGAGEFGNFASKVISILPNFELSAIADTNEETALELANRYNAKVYHNYFDLLKDEEIELVSINLPNHLHAQAVMQSLEANKRVLCEKPLGISNYELVNVLKVLEKKKGNLIVNYLLSHSDLYLKLKDIIKSEKYGRLKFISIENLATESTIKNSWYWQRQKSGGWFLTADIHFYDLIAFLTNEKGEVRMAKEFKQNEKTSAIFSAVNYGQTLVNIFHDFNAGYERVDFSARFIFDYADIIIKGWVPTEMQIRETNRKKFFKIKFDRELIYQKMVAENFKILSKMTHRQSVEHVKKAVSSSKIALDLQNFADRAK